MARRQLRTIGYLMIPDTFTTLTFPRSRLATSTSAGTAGHALPVRAVGSGRDEARRAAGSCVRRGRCLFTAWMIKALADAVARHREVHAVAAGRRKVVVFDSVDIALPVEREVEEARAPLPVLIREANIRTVHDIHRDIEAARSQDLSDESNYILGEHGFSRLAMQLYYALPQMLRLAVWKMLFRDPVRAKRLSGTVLVTTVGSTGVLDGWMLPTRSMHNLFIALGPIAKKPRVVGGEIVARDIMHLTVGFNHDVVDGVPARRFLDDLVRHVEKGEI